MNWAKVAKLLENGLDWGNRRIPAGVRSLLGLLCVIGGVFGFLPLIGFWLLPLGVALIALDVPPLHRRLRAWIARHRAPNDEED